MRWKIQATALIVFSLVAGIPAPTTATSDGPLDDTCSGVKRFGSPGPISVYPPNPLLPHQGLVVHPDTTTVALFVLEDDARTTDRARGTVWYLMSGSTGFAGKCEPILCPWFEAYSQPTVPQPQNVTALVALADQLSANDC